MRPEIPIVNQKWAPLFAEIMRTCWRREPAGRPSFAKIVQDIQRVRQFAGGNLTDSPRPLLHELPDERKSPDMHPVPLPPLPREYATDACRRFCSWCHPYSGHDGDVLREQYGRPLTFIC